jgi:hypothetical protein
VILAIDFRLHPHFTAPPTPRELAAAAAISAAPPPLTAVAPPADAALPAPTPEAKLQPQPTEPAPAAQPPEPTVSTTLPQVATLPVPTGQSETPPSASGEEETTAHQVAKSSKLGVLRNVTASRRKNAIAVHIEGSEPLQASASTLSNPERSGRCASEAPAAHRGQCCRRPRGERGALVNPLVTRVVVELARPHAYQLQPSGDSLTLRIEIDEVKSAGPQPVR